MWSNVEETITDGTSGLSPNASAGILFVGSSSEGAINKPLALGKRSPAQKLLGRGALTETLEDCQKNMADSSILAVRSLADIAGSIGSVSKGDGAGNAVISGEPAYGAEVSIEMLSAEEAALTISGVRTILPLPEDRTLTLGGLGLSAILPADAARGHRWSFSAIAPASSLEALKAAVDAALELFTPEAVVICQNASAEDAAFWGTEAEAYFEAEHKPVLFILPSALGEGANYEEAISAKVAEFAKTDARFVSILCQPGTVKDGSLRFKRQPLGFLAAALTKAGVSQSIGATRFFDVPNFALADGWTNAHSRALDEARFITLRTYAGLNGLFWSNGRTLAGDSSDYRFIEVVRTVHKAVRLARRASLPYMHAPGDEIGISNLVAEIRTALDKMTGSSPVEILGYSVDVPSGQDVVNNGLQVELSLYGVPIIRKIVLNFMFKYKENEGV